MNCRNPFHDLNPQRLKERAGHLWTICQNDTSYLVSSDGMWHHVSHITVFSSVYTCAFNNIGIAIAWLTGLLTAVGRGSFFCQFHQLEVSESESQLLLFQKLSECSQSPQWSTHTGWRYFLRSPTIKTCCPLWLHRHCAKHCWHGGFNISFSRLHEPAATWRGCGGV